MFSNGKAVDPWRTKPLQIADLSWQVQDVFFDFLMCWFDGSFFLSGDIPDVLMDGPLFFLRGGGVGGFGNFQRKKSCTAKATEKKNVQVEPWGKNRASIFYLPGPVFDLKKTLAQAIVHQKQSCTTLSETE